MRQKLSDWIERYRYMDWGVLYLRMAMGAGILIHNIGKMQNYNEIINTYPSLLHINSPATFVIITTAEVLMAVLLMLGVWVRFAASVMAVGMLWAAFLLGFPDGEIEFVYAVVYVTLVITGAGIFSFDAVACARSDKKSNE